MLRSKKSLNKKIPCGRCAKKFSKGDMYQCPGCRKHFCHSCIGLHSHNEECKVRPVRKQRKPDIEKIISRLDKEIAKWKDHCKVCGHRECVQQFETLQFIRYGRIRK